MGRKRDPRRDEAFEIWKSHKTRIKLKDIAQQLEVSEGTVRGWKAKDKWTDQYQPKPGAPKGNKNAVGKGAPKGNKNGLGHGAPKGNKNAAGHGAPPKNDNAVKTGEYKNFWEDVLDDEERDLLDDLEHVDPKEETKSEIRLYSLRERYILKRIKELKNGMKGFRQKTTKELIDVDDFIEIKDPSTGDTNWKRVKVNRLLPTKIEELEGDPLDELLKHEEALTRIQDKKIKALRQLHDITDNFEFRKFIETEKIKISKERLELEKNRNNPLAGLMAGPGGADDDGEDDLF